VPNGFEIELHEMTSATARVTLDASIGHCFALVSSKFAASYLQPQLIGSAMTAHFCAAEIRRGASAPVFVGILLYQFAPSASSNELVIGTAFASALGLPADEAVIVRLLPATRTATKVVCEPCTVDDSEVLEHNQLQAEATLLRCVRVVAPGMVLPVIIRDGLTLRFRVVSIGPANCTPCANLGEGTELHVATKTRQSAINAAIKSQPQPALLRIVPSESLVSPIIVPSQPTLTCSEQVAAAHNWSHGTELGFMDLAVVARTVSDAREARREQQRGQAVSAATNHLEGPQSPVTSAPSLEVSFSAPAVLRRSFRVRVAIDRGRNDVADPSGLPTASLRAAPSSLVNAPTNAHVFPNIPAQVRNSTEPDMHMSNFQSLSPSLEELKDVHGGAVVDEVLLSAKCRYRPSNEGASRRLPNACFAICGDRGCGKSELANAAAAASNRHIVRVRCAARLADTFRQLRRAMNEASLCAPSAVIVEDFDLACPAAQEGHATISSSDLSTMVSISALFTSWTRESNVDIAIIATIKSRESLNAVFTVTCEVFEGFYKVPPLGLEQRTSFLRYLYGSDLTHEERAALAGRMENFVPFDFIQVKRRVSEMTKQPTATAVGDAIRAVLEQYHPLSHSSAGLQRKPQHDDRQTVSGWLKVGGLNTARKALHQSIVLPSKFPRLFESLPLKTRSGVLLYGPPGCGKSFIIQALMEAENLNCIVVKGPEILDKYIGASEQKVREVFERAQAASPCVLFFDEFDSIAPQRGHDNTGVTDRVVNQLLCYLDGVETRKNVYVVAASSRPDLIDAALLRPGRLDKAILCGMPNAAERQEILEAHCRAIDVAADVDLGQLAAGTEGWTSADLAGLVATANLAAVQRALAAASSSLKLRQSTTAIGVSRADEINWDGEAENLDPLAIEALLQTTTTPMAAATMPSDAGFRGADDVSHVTMKDLRDAMRSSRCSIPEHERRRFDAIYSTFSGDGKAKRPVEQPGSRTTHA
jgi:SpoVK/Ycf46/Vps4 family AAA+-type ATPase